MRSKSILYGAANIPIEPTSNVDSRTTNNIVIKNYPSGTVSDAPTEIKKEETTTNSEAPMYPPPLSPLTSNLTSSRSVETSSRIGVDEYLLSIYQKILLDQDKELFSNLVSKDQILLPKPDLEEVVHRMTGFKCEIDLLDPDITCCGIPPPFSKIAQIRIIDENNIAQEFKYAYNAQYTELISRYNLCLKYVIV